VKTRVKLVTAVKSIFGAALLIGQVSIAQSTVVVGDIRFEGELGVPVSELQEYTQFLKGHSLEQSKILEQSTRAVRTALRRRGFWKSQVALRISATGGPAAAGHGAVLQVTVHAGLQYRIKDISFARLASEFLPGELEDAFHLRKGDIADGNELNVGIASLTALFKRKGLDYAAIPAVMFDDAARTLTFSFDIQK
jgi:outer membrane protein assembly factor BamA